MRYPSRASRQTSNPPPPGVTADRATAWLAWLATGHLMPPLAGDVGASSVGRGFPPPRGPATCRAAARPRRSSLESPGTKAGSLADSATGV